ncbi:hypothetical protein CIPAW_08G049600 [Carya illinoinensis]|uniref:Uncharacterized protein n=1 Tax=Carya illinoinensis TaxID=32201 RepID=A0A8T1PN52_CARIL|nr:hypothetical protein CIPAW_08G049600 [Carya illinoinensis]
MDRVCSDHFPIVLDCGGIQEGKRYFKFENMWLKVEGFVDKVRSRRILYYVEGSPSFILAGKLKALKEDLKRWSAEVFRLIDNQKRSLMEHLKALEEREVSAPLSKEDPRRKLATTSELEKVSLMEEISWRQKSRAL